MRLTAIRKFAWIVVVAFSAGLTTPALSSSFEAALPVVEHAAHVHADGTVHRHAATSPAEGVQAAGVQPVNVHPHCPGCVTAADCAMTCLGSAVLPTDIVVPIRLASRAWQRDLLDQPSGVEPSGDRDPPRPVPVR